MNPDTEGFLRRFRRFGATPSTDTHLALFDPGAKLDVAQWAGDDDLAFVEWSIQGALAGAPLTLRGCERFDFAGGLALHARAYFDTLEIAPRRAAAKGSE